MSSASHMIGVVLGVNCLEFFPQNDKKWVCVSQEESVACHLPAKNSLGRKNRQQANIPN